MISNDSRAARAATPKRLRAGASTDAPGGGQGPTGMASAAQPRGDRDERVPSPRLRILCIEDSPDDELFVRFALESMPYELDWTVAEDAAGMAAALAQVPDIVLCDYHLPRFSPFEAIGMLEAQGLDCPLVVVTRAIGEAAAVEVLRAGAADYVSKDRLATLPMVVGRALAIARQRRRQRELLDALREANERLRRMGNALVGAQEAERKHLAQELHDSLGQSLTALLLHLQAADRASDLAAGERYRRVGREILDQAIQQVKTLSFAVRPPQLDLLGLASTVGLLCSRMLEPAGVAYELRQRGTEPTPAPAALAVPYRIVQEALTNAVRHGRPQRVVVRLSFGQRRMTVTVADDGRGFEHGPHAGHGLLGMAERCELAGGRLRVRSRPGRGTVLRASLPLAVGP